MWAALIALGLQTIIPEPATAPVCFAHGQSVCLLPAQITEDEALVRLGTNLQALWRDGDTLHVVARRRADRVRMCCSIQHNMERIGENGIWGMSFRLERLDEAYVTAIPVPPEQPLEGTDFPSYLGPNAASPPTQNGDLVGEITSIMMESAYFDGPREVTFFTPSGSEEKQSLPVVFASDGPSIEGYARIAEALVEQCQVRPFAIVALTPGRTEGRPTGLSSDPRSQEYLWGVDEARFMALQNMLASEIIPFAEDQYAISADPRDRMVFGVSSGAAWSISTALLQADLIRHSGAASLLWHRSFEVTDAIDPRLTIHIGGGLYENTAVERGENAVARLNEGGAAAKFDLWISGHSQETYEYQFAEAVQRAFPPSANCD